MISKPHIEFYVMPEDLSVSPLGYKVDIGDKPYVPVPSMSITSFDNTGEFSYSTDEGATFSSFPRTGLPSPVAGTLIRCTINKERVCCNPILVKGEKIYRISTDGKSIVSVKPVPGLIPSAMGVNPATNNIYMALSNHNSLVSLSPFDWSVKNSTPINSDCITIAFDLSRGVVWQISASTVILKKTSGEVVASISTPSTVVEVYSLLVHKKTGDLYFCYHDGGDNVLAHIENASLTMSSVASTSASSMSQWSYDSILFANESNNVYIYNGTTVVLFATIPTYQPFRIASSYPDPVLYFYDANRNTFGKYNTDTSSLVWYKQVGSIISTGSVEMRVNYEDQESGRIIQFWSSELAGSIRDFESEIDEGLVVGTVALPQETTVGETLSWYPARCAFVKHYPTSATTNQALEESSVSSGSSSVSSVSSVNSSSLWDNPPAQVVATGAVGATLDLVSNPPPSYYFDGGGSYYYSMDYTSGRWWFSYSDVFGPDSGVWAGSISPEAYIGIYEPFSGAASGDITVSAV